MVQHDFNQYSFNKILLGFDLNMIQHDYDPYTDYTSCLGINAKRQRRIWNSLVVQVLPANMAEVDLNTFPYVKKLITPGVMPINQPRNEIYPIFCMVHPIVVEEVNQVRQRVLLPNGPPTQSRNATGMMAEEVTADKQQAFEPAISLPASNMPLQTSNKPSSGCRCRWIFSQPSIHLGGRVLARTVLP